MKKKIYLFLVLILCLSFNAQVNAAASLSTSASSVKVGDSFKVNINLSGVASWTINLSSSGPVSNCSGSWADTTSNALNGNQSYSVTCKATGTGNINVSLSGNTSDQNEKKQNVSAARTITVASSTSNNNTQNNQKEQTKETEENKSTNLFLKSLSVEGHQISPAFDKNITNYNLTLSNEIKKIKINAVAEDTKATVSGTGEKEIKVGDNSFVITVTQNGIKKTYNLNAKVDEKPIIVKIKGKEYTVIKDKQQLPELTMEHEDLTLNIEEQEVPAYRIDKLNYVLVGLKDEKGNISLYKFISYKDDEKPAEYIPFSLITVPETNIVYLDFPSSIKLNNYKKYTEKINDQNLEVYKNSKNSDFSLFYGMNIADGKKHIYQYDKKEKTIQIYNDNIIKKLQKEIDNKSMLVYGLISLLSLFLILTFILFIANQKKRKQIKYYQKKTNIVN